MPEAELDVPRLIRRVLVVTLVAVAMYGAIVVYRGLSAISASFAGFAWWTFGAACGLSLVNYLLRFLKWEIYLRVLDIRGVPKVESLLTFLSGFVLTVTPGKVGEVFKSIVLHRTRGVAFERSAPIVIAERVTDLIAVIIMIAVGSLGFDGGLFWAVAGAVVVAALLVFVASPRLSGAVVDVVAKVKVGAKLAPKLRLALLQLRELTTPLRLVGPTLLSVVGWSLEGVGLWLVLGGFGVQTPLSLTIFFYATATLAGALVPLPGGLGVVEELLEEQLTRLGGVPTSAATAAMLLIRLATLWFAVVLGFIALSLLRLRHPGLTQPHSAVRGEAELEGRGDGAERQSGASGHPEEGASQATDEDAQVD